jgi:two-component system, response regulator PdtaR
MRILVVDDEPLVRRSLQKALQFNKHEVLLAEDGRQGIDIWLKENPDLVFLDILMPSLSGLQVLKELGNKKNCKVILMSAYSGVHDQETVKQMGADLFLEKPFEDIMQVVRAAEELVSSHLPPVRR